MTDDELVATLNKMNGYLKGRENDPLLVEALERVSNVKNEQFKRARANHSRIHSTIKQLMRLVMEDCNLNASKVRGGIRKFPHTQYFVLYIHSKKPSYILKDYLEEEMNLSNVVVAFYNKTDDFDNSADTIYYELNKEGFTSPTWI